MESVLVITISISSATSLKKYLNNHLLKKQYKFLFNTPQSSKHIDLVVIYEDCCDIIRKQDVTSLISHNDWSSLVHSALAQTFPHLKGTVLCYVYLSHRDLMLCFKTYIKAK